MQSTSVRLAALCLALLLIPLSAAGCTDPECDDVSAWLGFTRFTIKQSYSGHPLKAQWTGSYDEQTHDISVDVVTSGADEPMNGTVVMVGGRIMLTRGLTLKPGYEIDALDAPVLSMRLLMGVLHRLFPEGPAQISGTQTIDHTDQVGIRFATPSASGYVPAPWHVTGKVSRLADGRVPFDLALSFSTKRADRQLSEVTMAMNGELAVRTGPLLRDADSLEGWTVYGIGPRKTVQGGSTMLDYGASPQEVRYRTIGDVRALIAAQENPGKRDVARDFTGFWKEKCEESFGLSILHQGNEGKYAIVFCGPGGCDDPAQSRLTFITGDQHFDAVSDDELVRKGPSGDKQTYRRCAREPSPLLKRRN